MYATLLAISIVAFFLGVLGRIAYDRAKTKSTISDAEKQAAKILELAEREAEAQKKEIEVEARGKLYHERQEFDDSTRRQKDEFERTSEHLRTLERELSAIRAEHEATDREIEAKKADMAHRLQALSRKESELDKSIHEERLRLEKTAGLSSDEAKRMLMKSIEKDARRDSAEILKQLEDETRESADRKARQVISLAIGRWASAHTAETTVSVVHIPSEDMKGRIIGREGRNIRALENATGVDLIIDDTPETVVLSSFNIFRREVARMALEQLLQDGRIHPSRIEEIVQKVRDEMEAQIVHIGEQAAVEAGIMGLHPELVRLIGKLKYRTSYGQNILQHTLEVSHLAAAMAAEIGANVEVAKRGAFLHDIGKAMDQDKEGTHTALGVEILKKYGENPAVIHCVEAHHNDVELQTVEAYLVQAADAVSASRPGARRESLETYIKRLKKLEEIALSFGGVNQAYALQAGREIRIMVAHELLNDAQASQLARDVARKVEAELEYPGQIKVQVIREMRTVEYAK
jgi:ribonuclease Y